MASPVAAMGAGVHTGLILPFLLPLSHQIANALESNDVQAISFRFGHVIVLAEHFREVANALRDGRVTAVVDPTSLDASTVAEYSAGANRITARSHLVMWTPQGRAAMVHECSHAVSDHRARSTAILHEEAAAFVCEAWYLLNQGVNSDPGISAGFFTIAQAMRTRAASEGRPVRATGAEINQGRRLARVDYGYESDFYRDSDGF